MLTVRSRMARLPAGLWQALFVALIVIAVFGVAIAANPALLSVALPDLSSKLDGLSGDPLAAEKTRREIVQLELANRLAGSIWAGVIALVPAVTALVGGVGLFVTVRREQTERVERARRELAEREKEREEREAEQRRRAEESYRTTVQNLYAEPVALRASAAVSLATFIRPEYASYQDDVILVALAKTKKGMESDRNVRRLVVRALEGGLRLRLSEIPEAQRSFFVDFYDCDLGKIDLSGLDLHEADLGHAVMSHAVLSESNLRRVRGIGVVLDHARLGRANLNEARLVDADLTEAQLHEVNAVSIRLERAKLAGAEFYQARLQEAHFRDADLTGAKFQDADINNAFFKGARLDDVALRSIAKGAKNWDKAHFDEEHLRRLRDFVAPAAGRGGRTSEEPPPDAADAQPQTAEADNLAERATSEPAPPIEPPPAV